MNYLKQLKNAYLLIEDILENLWRMIISTCILFLMAWVFNKENADFSVMRVFMLFICYWAMFTYAKYLIVRKLKIYKEYFGDKK